MKKALLLTVAASIALASSAPAESLVIARLAPAASPTAIAAKYSLVFKEKTVGGPFALFAAPTLDAAEAAEVQMRLDPEIIWAEDDDSVSCPENQGLTVQKGSGLPAVGDRNALQQINRNLLTQINWSRTLADGPGRTVRVAILDTGLSPRQPALWAKVDKWANFVEPTKKALDKPMLEDSSGNGIPDEAVGHGTMVAGIIDQVAPQSRFVIVRIADSDGLATAWSLVKGLAFAVGSGAEVANVSLGSLTSIPAISDVLDWCEERHMLVVAAIGNDGIKAALNPARSGKAVCVGGLKPDGTKASFSNWNGVCDASAPAVGFASQYWDGQLAIWSGTSFSTPVVTAAIADCLRRLPPTLPRTIRKAILASGANLDSANPAYKRQLGTLIDCTNLDAKLKNP